MRRDYAPSHKSQSKHHSQVRLVPWWLWLLSSLVVIVLITLFVKSSKLGMRQIKMTSVTKLIANEVKSKQITAPVNDYEFYTLLPKMKVVVEKNLQQIVKPIQVNKKAGASLFYLQVAAFKHYADADRLKARLILSGYPVNIKKSTSLYTTWHRVIIGPYATKQNAERVQAVLSDDDIQSLVVHD